MIWSIIYLVLVLTANYTATWFIPLPWLPFLGGALPLGTLLFGGTFTARDYVHRLGRSHVYVMICVTVLCAFVESVALGVPVRIIIASCLAIGLSETADTEIYHKLRRQKWLVRVLSSNAVSVPTDTILFNVVAFWGVFSTVFMLQVTYADILAKYATSIVVAGFRYFTRERSREAVYAPAK